MTFRVTYDPSKEQPVPRAGALEIRLLEYTNDPSDPSGEKKIQTQRVFRFEPIGGVNSDQILSDEAITLLEKNDDWKLRIEWEAIKSEKLAGSASLIEQHQLNLSQTGIDETKVTPAILLDELPPPAADATPQKTAADRTKELEQAFSTQGFRAVETEASRYNITKPSTGWKDAIPLIVQREISEGVIVQ